MCHTFFSDGLKVSSKVLVAISHFEGQQHDIGGRHQGEGAGHWITQPAAQRYERADTRYEKLHVGMLAAIIYEKKHYIFLEETTFFINIKREICSPMKVVDSPVQNAPSHGQQSIIHSQGVIHTVAGLNEERGHSQTDKGARNSSELYMATYTTP